MWRRKLKKNHRLVVSRMFHLLLNFVTNLKEITGKEYLRDCVLFITELITKISLIRESLSVYLGVIFIFETRAQVKNSQKY